VRKVAEKDLADALVAEAWKLVEEEDAADEPEK
jgi:hypothetical protein